jgi:hypothetical protein
MLHNAQRPVSWVADVYRETMVNAMVDSNWFANRTGHKLDTRKAGAANLKSVGAMLSTRCVSNSATQWNRLQEAARTAVDHYLSASCAVPAVMQCTGAEPHSPIWSAPMSSCKKTRQAKENTLSTAQREFFLGHDENGLPDKIGAIVVFDAGTKIDDLSFTQADLAAMSGGDGMGVWKRFVQPENCRARTDAHAKAYAPYGPLFVSLVIDILSAWGVMLNVIPSESVLQAGEERVKEWCEGLMRQTYSELYDEQKKLSWRLDWDASEWEEASEESRGVPVMH